MTEVADKKIPKRKLGNEFRDLSLYEWQEVMPGVISNQPQTVGWFKYIAERVDICRRSVA